MRRVPAVAAAVAVLLTGGAVAAADPLLPAAPTDAVDTWLQRAGLSAPAAAPDARSLTPASSSAALACPAAPRLVPATADTPGASGTDEDFVAQPVETLARVRALAGTSTTAGLQLLPLVGPDGAATLGAPVPATPAGGLELARSDGTASVVVTGAPAAGSPGAQPVAVQSAVTAAGDLRGLAVGVCAPPRSSSWLVGGGVEVGRSNRLVLANPGATPAVVDVTVLTGTGPVAPPAGQGVLVPAGQVRELLVEGLVSPDPLLAVGVTATGGTVTASLVDTALSGITPAGVEAVTATTAATRQVLSGLPAADRAVLRLAVPGSEPAVVGWRTEGVAGPVSTATASATTVPAGTVVDVELDRVTDGLASLVVESDVPVLAAVQIVRAGPAESLGAADRAWVPAAPALDGVAQLALPADGVAAQLALTAGLPDDATGGEVGPATLRVVPLLADGADGPPADLTVLPGTTSVVAEAALDGAVGVRLEVTGGVVHAGTLLAAPSGDDPAGRDLVSVVAVPAPVAAPDDVTLRSAPTGRWP